MTFCLQVNYNNSYYCLIILLFILLIKIILKFLKIECKALLCNWQLLNIVLKLSLTVSSKKQKKNNSFLN